jgi:DNA-binding NarL/FixJ family response regulator
LGRITHLKSIFTNLAYRKFTHYTPLPFPKINHKNNITRYFALNFAYTKLKRNLIRIDACINTNHPTLKLMTPENLIKIAIADDHKIFRDGIKMALSGKANLKMLWEAEDGKDMMHKIAIKMPDVLLMDIRMPEIDGINAIQLIRKEYEELKIIVLTMYDDQQMISKMMEMGANAYLTKTTDPEEIYEAILTCMNDDFYFNELVNKAVMGKLMQKKNIRQQYGINAPISFNEKEIKILQLLAEDKTTEEISKVIFLSPRTIETIRQNMKTKVNAKTIGGLIVYALRNKLID